MQNDPRSRILLLLQLLLKQTDEHHYATGADILRFWETHGIQTTRKKWKELDDEFGTHFDFVAEFTTK